MRSGSYSNAYSGLAYAHANYASSYSNTDRKAVNDMETFMELTEDDSPVSFPLCNLIPEITEESNLLSSFNRVIRHINAKAKMIQ